MPAWVCCTMVSNLYNHALIAPCTVCARVQWRACVLRMCSTDTEKKCDSWLTHTLNSHRGTLFTTAGEPNSHKHPLSLCHTHTSNKTRFFAVTTGMFESPIKDPALPVELCVICSKNCAAFGNNKKSQRETFAVFLGFVNAECLKARRLSEASLLPVGRWCKSQRRLRGFCMGRIKQKTISYINNSYELFICIFVTEM